MTEEKEERTLYVHGRVSELEKTVRKPIYELRTDDFKQIIAILKEIREGDIPANVHLNIVSRLLRLSEASRDKVAISFTLKRLADELIKRKPGEKKAA